MKFLNNTLAIATIISIGSLDARRMGVSVPAQPAAQQKPVPQAPAPKPAPAVQPPAMPPAALGLTYKQLQDSILNESPTAAGMFKNNIFNPTFIDNMVKHAKTADIGKTGLKTLLQMARDKWAIFSGDTQIDSLRLQVINKQIDAAVAKM